MQENNEGSPCVANEQTSVELPHGTSSDTATVLGHERPSIKTLHLFLSAEECPIRAPKHWAAITLN